MVDARSLEVSFFYEVWEEELFRLYTQVFHLKNSTGYWCLKNSSCKMKSDGGFEISNVTSVGNS